MLINSIVLSHSLALWWQTFLPIEIKMKGLYINKFRPPGISGYLLASCMLALPGWSMGAAPTERQMHLLSSNCVQCHARPGIGAPLMGNPADWKERVTQGEDVLLQHVIEGKGGMPPLGYCSACNEEDFRVLIRLMVPGQQVQP